MGNNNKANFTIYRVNVCFFLVALCEITRYRFLMKQICLLILKEK